MKKHFKMYKSGKNWCYMALATVMTAVGLAMTSHQTVLADTSTQASVQQNAQNDDNNSTTLTVKSDDTSQNNQQSNADNVTAQSESFAAISNNASTNNSDQSNRQTNSWLTDSKIAAYSDNSQVQNGWVKNNNGQMTYYQNGQVASGRQYVNLPTIPDTNVSGNTNWYLMDNGVAQSGLQEWQGSHYYFDSQTYLVVKNTYVDPNHDNSGYLLGKDGIALNGIQKWQGTYYAFDKTTYRLVKNQKFQEWGYTYQIDDQGRVASGLYKEANGDIYYYNPVTYLAETNTYIVPAGTQNGYLFGKDGKALTGVQKWQGTFYYFDPTTKQLVRNNYVKSQWGLYYMFGQDGKIVTGPYQWQGSIYYFDQSSYLKVVNDYRVPAGSDRGYLLGSDGRALSGVQKWQGTFYYFDPSTYLLSKENYVKSQWGDWYMVGNDGRVVSGPYKWQGTWYFFDFSSYLLVKNSTRDIDRATYTMNDSGAIVSVINNAVAISQRPELPTGCEMTAVAMMLQYAGVNITKEQVANETPRSSNPYYGFVGNPYSNYGYGLWVAPSGIASVVSRNVGSSWNMTGCSLSQLQSQLISMHLVVVWQAHMHGFGTHAITLTGFNNNGFYYNDPWTGQKNAFMLYSTFEYNWRDAPASRGALSY